MNKILEGINPEKIELVAGSGNKFLHLADHKSDFYLNLVPGFKHWDMCGSEAILLSRFGIVSDARRRPLFYDDQAKQHTMRGGIVAARNKRVFEICEEGIEDVTGVTLAVNHELVAKEADEVKRLKKINYEAQKAMVRDITI